MAWAKTETRFLDSRLPRATWHLDKNNFGKLKPEMKPANPNQQFPGLADGVRASLKNPKHSST